MNERRTDINQKYYQKTGVSSVIAKTERNRMIVPIVTTVGTVAHRISHHIKAVFHQNIAVEDEPYVA